MLDPKVFLDLIKSQGIHFSTGVPDSLLKDFCACIVDSGSDIIAANEGGAVALAAGHHLATGEIPFVYMQNSGFGNIINPLTSLIDPEVYSIPMLIMVGWRGEPGVKDEPQHIKQGRINEALIEALEVRHDILSSDIEEAQSQVETAVSYMQSNQAPYILLVRKDTFAPYKMQNLPQVPDYEMNREDAVKEILNKLSDQDVVVSTTGKTSREVFEKRAADHLGHQRDFLTVGCMGHASQIALGIALAKQERKVFCLDGDGAFIMHMGSAGIIADQKPKNYYHIVINNGAHDSVGGQPTIGFNLDLEKIASGCGYQSSFSVKTKAELAGIWNEFIAAKGPVFLEIKTKKGARKDLGRPTIKPIDNKIDFMNNLK
ncbi:phosphonopyruvate decarboxylase [Reichenbachiella ulvae]|uniref:Phosphonopyruvate decarboxylase n=1 Tax=Reichenbachiella ulvae TaxID=2980104 RepID=A0ABT3CUD1_9BACT|nr:phosphonopyruvate decarboxylase [Reichenbachiella ulvae]MCV9387242.1 phosphonopyruvate decarboxylase [Reichenbachiella ulvae]